MNKLRASVKNTCFSALKNESGQGALIAVLILLVIGSIMLPPLMGLIGTGLRAGQLHEEKMQSYYAADAGVEDALWQIKYDEVEDLLSGYNQYEFGVSYPYPDPLSINNNLVNVSIENIWIPEDYISTPSASEAQEIVDDQTLVVTGRATSGTEYQIKIVYNYQELEDYEDIYRDLEIDSIGIWLPQGFNYIEGSSNLEDDELDPPYLCEPSVRPYKSGEAVVWDFSNGALFTNFPGVAPLGYPLVSSITFEFSSASGQNPDSALSWVITDDVDDLSYSWDADTRVFNIESISSQTTVTAHTAKTEMRKMTSATEGDYFATGSSLLQATGDQNYRNRLYEESNATIETDEDGIDGIPSQGMVELALLYWTGWIDWHGYDPSGSDIQLFYDDCNDLYSPASNWEYGSDWHESSSTSAFYAHHNSGGSENNRIITTKDGLIDLSGTTGKTVEVSWRSWNQYSSYYNYQESDDCLYYSYSGNGGLSWSSWQSAFCNDIGTSPITYSYEIPDTVGYRTDEVKIRFRIYTYDGSNEYVYIDNVSVTTEGSAGGSLKYPDNPTPETLTTLVEESARVHQVRFGPSENNNIVTADAWEVEPTTGAEWEDTWSYCCFKDVTNLVWQWIEDENVSNNAAGTYTLGHVIAENEVDPDFSFGLYGGEETGYPLGTPALSQITRYQYSYAGWSLVVIYSSPETKGHQLYLYDIQNPSFTFTEAWHTNPDFDGDGEPGGSISGFLVPEPIAGEEIAAKLTVFVGEGDNSIYRDYIIMGNPRTGHELELSNSASPYNNVWNSASPGLSVQGIDIDTFYIEWNDGILEPGDTSAQIDMPTGGRYPPYNYSSDGFNIIYIILSFRSEVTTGGTLSYLIGGG
jgi:hypothetical protein